VVSAVLLAAVTAPRPFAAFNVATGDYVTVREIAQLATEVLGIAPGSTEFSFTGGARGWKGDVPVVRINTDKIRALGWANAMDTREALSASLESMLEDDKAGRFS